MSLFSSITNSNPETPFIKIKKKKDQSLKLDFYTVTKCKQKRKDGLEEDKPPAEITQIAEEV